MSTCLLTAVGCKVPPADDGDGDGDGETGDLTGDGDGDPSGDGDRGCTDALDILMVIDNSGTMGEAQRRLVLALPGLIEALDAAEVDWRVGITTTD
ncbi:MAG TPA: hypothetical protein VK034_12840, partial [Enhygromyxa sp.]|nr:hypothetical protein [Enhygromyxa sp.]